MPLPGDFNATLLNTGPIALVQVTLYLLFYTYKGRKPFYMTHVTLVVADFLQTFCGLGAVGGHAAAGLRGKLLLKG